MTTVHRAGDIRIRAFDGDDAFRRVRDLLIETHPLTPTGFNWEVRRWDGWRYYTSDPNRNPDRERQVCLWETTGGALVGAVHPEGRGDAHLQLHPACRFIEPDMLDWAEGHLAESTADGRHRALTVFVFDYDAPRRRLLERRGYERTGSGGYTYRMRLAGRIFEEPQLAEGYTLRTTRPDREDGARIAELLNAAFGRDFHVAAEFQTFAGHASSYHQELDLVAVAPDGTFASYVGTPYEPVNRLGIFEPVCTHPDHLRRGLARALMQESLRRLQALGATDVHVGTGEAEAANRTYEAIGFTEAYHGEDWRRIL